MDNTYSTRKAVLRRPATGARQSQRAHAAVEALEAALDRACQHKDGIVTVTTSTKIFQGGICDTQVKVEHSIVVKAVDQKIA